MPEPIEHPHPVVNEVLKFRTFILGQRQYAQQLVVKLRAEIEGNRISYEHLADAAWLCQEIEKYTEEVRKEFSKLETLLEKVTCAAWTMACAADPAHPGHVEGVFARATPDMGLVPDLPAKHTDEYKALLRFMHCPESLIEADVLRPHWPHLCEMLAHRDSQGLPPPPGIRAASLKPRYVLKSLKLKKGVKIDD
jgi:hypothetical protein